MTAPLPPMHHETHDRELLNMTAPLPPLQPFPDFVYRSIEPARRVLLCQWADARAKLAVRETLERVDALCNEVFRPTPKDVSDKIRAMLKEYEG